MDEAKPLPDRIDRLKALVKTFPALPGVYLMRDRLGTIIYVGKAKSLVNRVRSYFLGQKDPKTTLLVRRIESIEHIVTRSEYEALLLENNLIKQHSPQFNISLKDGKSYPLIRITKEAFPRIYKTRRLLQDGSEYFGPYANLRTLELSLELINKLFPLRRCPGTPLRKRQSPCLYHHLGQCGAPCVGKISPEEYGRIVLKARNLLRGRTKELQKDLKGRMEAEAAALNFEAAAQLRDTLKALDEVAAPTQVMDLDQDERDYVALAAEGAQATFVVLQMRGGKLSGRDLFHTGLHQPEDEALSDFLVQYYSRRPRPRHAVYLSRVIDTAPVTQALAVPLGAPSGFDAEADADAEADLAADAAQAGQPPETDAAPGRLPVPEFFAPEGGRHYQVLRMAVENATLDLKQRLSGGARRPALEELQRVLGLPRLPQRIEGFDIAQLDGNFPVASLVSFWNGFPDKKQYRTLNLRSLQGAIDDFQSMKEALSRRYTRLVNEEAPLPDLILVDGGRGQVSAAQSILELLDLDIPLAGLAKQHEEIFRPGVKDPIRLPAGHPALRILQAVRDETHRFATAANQRQRHKRVAFQFLEALPGIGPVRSRALMQRFGSLERLGTASIEDLCAAGLPRPQAEALRAYLEDRSTREQLVTDLKRTRRL